MMFYARRKVISQIMQSFTWIQFLIIWLEKIIWEEKYYLLRMALLDMNSILSIAKLSKLEKCSGK